MQTDPTLSIACVSEARVHCADPEGTMLHADKLSKYLRSVATRSSAGQLHAVLVAMPTSFICVAGATCFHTLAFCSVLVAQASRFCLGVATFNRAQFLAVCTAEPSDFDFVGAVIH